MIYLSGLRLVADKVIQSSCIHLRNICVNITMRAKNELQVIGMRKFEKIEKMLIKLYQAMQIS